MAGVVEDASLAVGPGRRFRAGDRVYACTDGFLFYNKWGAYAEYMVVKEEQLAAIPEGLSFEEAGGVPLCALTAWQALEGAMPLAGKRVLVHAGAGGVGCFAVQIAKALGAHVTATCGSRNVEFVTQTLGADVAVDYSASDFEAPCRESAANKYDCVVDLIGGDYEIRSMRCLKPRGHYANVLNSG